MPAEGESSDSQLAGCWGGGDRLAGAGGVWLVGRRPRRIAGSCATRQLGHVIATTGTPVQGGTAYWAEQPLSPPNYIFPLVSGAYYSNENVYDFQTLMYRPLYWYGDRGTPGVDYALSLAERPRVQRPRPRRHDHAQARAVVRRRGRERPRRDLLDQPAEGQQGRLGLVRARRLPGQRHVLDRRSARARCSCS